jgi:amidophosphoribosyltransferase
LKTIKFLAPGEIYPVERNSGLVSRTPGRPNQQICTFLWIYTGFPASSYENNQRGARTRTLRPGAGATDKDIEADVVSGVPDSGVGHAIGYAMESKKPYRRPLVKYTAGYGRSYTPHRRKLATLSPR